MRESSARSSSVSSTGRSPIVGGFGMDARFPGRPPGAGGPPPQSMPPPPQPFPPNGAGAPPPPHNLLAMQAGPQQPVSNPVGLGSMFGSNAFGGSQDLLRSAHPGANQPFGGQPMAMSPSSQMMRSGMPPAPQRQNSASGVGWQIQGPGQQRGPPTPSQQMDFQPQPPPTSSQVRVFRFPQVHLVSTEISLKGFSTTVLFVFLFKFLPVFLKSFCSCPSIFEAKMFSVSSS
ncbi:unnamed protein product [Haemonchus placei]|uniref:WH2 domain-containing protein n=1 Tax=Haemonchus placei TaxID=6290 RepID=A0A0N4WA41_HAEPC|nr:unnamed protein product [Haemonchus placei]